jgi:hypothetical protein
LCHHESSYCLTIQGLTLPYWKSITSHCHNPNHLITPLPRTFKEVYNDLENSNITTLPSNTSTTNDLLTPIAAIGSSSRPQFSNNHHSSYPKNNPPYLHYNINLMVSIALRIIQSNILLNLLRRLLVLYASTKLLIHGIQLQIALLNILHRLLIRILMNMFLNTTLFLELNEELHKGPKCCLKEFQISSFCCYWSQCYYSIFC